MFDKLIVSDEQGAEFKGRSRYFIVSTFVVGIMFITAVVFSLYAADIGLGNDQFEISMMVAPVMPEVPEPPKHAKARNQPLAKESDLPVRNQNMLRLDEVPLKVPEAVSVTKNTSLARPPGTFDIRIVGPEGGGGGGEPGDVARSGGIPDGSSSSNTSLPVAAAEIIPVPPPVIKAKPPVPRMVSKGVINGQAKSLPPPPYPAPAKMVNAHGTVSVQITIDETGKVISSRAIDGHPLLKGAAEKAAWNAIFSPTLLSQVPVKVTGVIVYNFKRN